MIKACRIGAYLCAGMVLASFALAGAQEPMEAVPQQQALICARLTPPAGDAEATGLIQNAMDACAAQGGGQVALQGGRFLTGPIRLASGVELHLERDAVLEAVSAHDRYRAAYINWAFQADEALISAVDVHDAAITGTGTIDGRGDTWWAEAEAERLAGNPRTVAAGIPASNGLPRPWLIETYQARRVRITGVRIVRSPMWTIVLRYTEDAGIQGVDIENPADSPNTDGIDIVASQAVTVRDSTISTGDDCITLKSGLPGSPLPAQATSDVHLEGLRLRDGHGLSIGSETLYGVHDVTVDTVDFDGTMDGVRIKSGRDRGSQLAHFRFGHLTMRNVGTAISISAYYPRLPPDDDPAQPVGDSTPFISDVVISDLTATGGDNAGLLAGLPEAPLRDIELADVAITAARPLVVRNADLTLRNVTIRETMPTADPGR